MMTVPPPDDDAPSRPPHPASSAAAPSTRYAPRRTEWNRIGLRGETANIIRLDAPSPLRARESFAMRRREHGGFTGVERRWLTLRFRQRGAQRIANRFVGGRAPEARAERRRGKRRRQRLRRKPGD